MKLGLFSKLAWTGIKKNRRLYIPYILTCVGMVMMFYIIDSLFYCPLLSQMSGGGEVRLALSFGRWVIAVFSMIFLFYTNSFLIRRRNREFGLYNILGMDKRNVSKIIVLESLIISIIGIAAGIALGIIFSKFAELGLLNVLREGINYSFAVEPDAVLHTIEVFAVVFFFILLNALFKVYRMDPLSLLHSEKTGEKQPKGNWLIALIGVILLATAYYVAVSIESPLSALLWFFVAVIMVIIATYMLFIAGSVVFCRILQKNKRYYYKPNHFVSVSSMVYRMKRNGAGLASICILSTMVLVMLSATISLYAGEEDSLRSRYPRNIIVDMGVFEAEDLQEDNLNNYRSLIAQVADEYNIEQKDIIDYRMADIAGLMENGRLETDVTALDTFQMDTYDNVFSVYIIPLEDYNRLAGKNEILAPDETIIYCYRTDYKESTIQIADSKIMKVKEVLTEFVENGASTSLIIPSVFMVVDDFESFIQPIKGLADYNGEQMLFTNWYYGFDIDAEDSVHREVISQLRDVFHNLNMEKGKIKSLSCESSVAARENFYTLYGSLFFLGIMLSIVFVSAAVLIIYYKQVSEGYEDRSRFEIMQKVGMTKRDIRKSINSQILTVFFMPLIFAGLHLAFAFPMIWRLLQMFNLRNLNLLIIVTIGAFLIFALFYGIIYRITSNAYYSIVSGAGERE